MKILDAVKQAFKNATNHCLGKCNICGRHTFFVCIDALAARNNMYCLFCRSSSRKRHVAKVLLNLFTPHLTAINDISRVGKYRIYNADVGDAFGKILNNYQLYVCSSFIPGITPGTEISSRVFCQNLENLNFSDKSFDIVITEDVFEHLKHHEKGFKEVHRILKTGGYHIFTVPCYFDRTTLVRVDTRGDKEIHLLPPEYHGDRIRGKILAYRTFGIDIFPLLTKIGFDTQVDFSNYLDRKSGIFDSYVFYSKKVD
ncbi:class I SAM-dependent methyltransferase [Mastigocoleus testarum]|uniref:Methyltransferase type 11 n=1 Tax=Mastigocoleus testarum BC008 TaxID=371196 RepID=A0A0V7ZGD0_9CYAN|nr:class I SAM-dependent methyltransferase [Mastigocoleus testarum]KST63652.1 methyltransferase type 11 [Mastigocoleus testarum BC008]